MFTIGPRYKRVGIRILVPVCGRISVIGIAAKRSSEHHVSYFIVCDNLHHFYCVHLHTSKSRQYHEGGTSALYRHL